MSKNEAARTEAFTTRSSLNTETEREDAETKEPAVAEGLRGEALRTLL